MVRSPHDNLGGTTTTTPFEMTEMVDPAATPDSGKGWLYVEDIAGTMSLVFEADTGVETNLLAIQNPLTADLDFDNTYFATNLPDPTDANHAVNLTYFESNTIEVAGASAGLQVLRRNSGDTAYEFALMASADLSDAANVPLLDASNEFSNGLQDISSVLSVLTLENVFGDALGSRLVFEKSRGIPGAPADVQAGDLLGTIRMDALISSSYETGAQIEAMLINATTGATRLILRTNDGSTLDDRIILQSDGTIEFNSSKLDLSTIAGTSVSELDEEMSPAGGDWLFGTEAGGAIRKFDVGNISSDTSVGFHDLDIDASGMYPTITDGCTASQQYETATNNVNYWALEFDGATNQNAQFRWKPPRNWDNNATPNVTFVPHWTADNGSAAETVIWNLSGVAVSDDDPLDAALGSAQSSSDVLIATGDMHVGPESSAITIAGTPADGDTIVFNIERNASSDTHTGIVRLLGIRLKIKTDAATSE